MLRNVIASLAALSLIVSYAGAAIVTLYDLSVSVETPTFIPSFQLPSATIDRQVNYKAIKPTPGSPVTTYEVEEIRSLFVVVDHTASTTVTVLSTPTTFTYTRVEGQSVMQESYDAVSTPSPVYWVFPIADFSSDCEFDREKITGSCKVAGLDPLFPVTTTETVNGSPTTYEVYTTFTGKISGALVPIATVTTDAASSLLPVGGLATAGIWCGAVATAALTALFQWL